MRDRGDLPCGLHHNYVVARSTPMADFGERDGYPIVLGRPEFALKKVEDPGSSEVSGPRHLRAGFRQPLQHQAIYPSVFSNATFDLSLV